jgi:hypothetical protein
MIPKNDFSLSEGMLVVKSGENGQLLWVGNPKGYKVENFIPVKEANDCIVLLEWLKPAMENQKNLLRINSFGEIIWEVGDPSKILYTGPAREDEIESYTGIVGMNGNILEAYAYSGYADFIDTSNGEIIRSIFVK